jgi:hypothetical protein
MPLGFIEPPSEWQDITIILSIILCFILIVIAIWFAMQLALFPAIFSIVGALFIIKIIRAMRGAN